MTAGPLDHETIELPVEERADFVRAVEAALADKRPSVPFEKVRRWLQSWGTKNELPPPE